MNARFGDSHANVRIGGGRSRSVRAITVKGAVASGCGRGRAAASRGRTLVHSVFGDIGALDSFGVGDVSEATVGAEGADGIDVGDVGRNGLGDGVLERLMYGRAGVIVLLELGREILKRRIRMLCLYLYFPERCSEAI